MSSKKIKILFVPVSAAKGSGEYQRTLLLANALQAYYGNNVDIRFVISNKATYANKVPYKTYKLTSSATMQPLKLHAIIDEFAPDLVMFDSAGRVKSYRYAKKSGCKVALTVSRPKKRNKALSMRVGRYLDLIISTSHVPNLCRLSLKEKLALHLFKHLDVLLTNALFQSPNITSEKKQIYQKSAALSF